MTPGPSDYVENISRATKRCPVPGCKRSRKEWALTCLKCWQAVPESLKVKLARTKPRSAGRISAVREVLRWFDHGQPRLL